jgi:hypothetical protein
MHCLAATWLAMINVKIKENSWLARIAAYKLKSASVAMVIGRSIYLHNTKKEDFLNNHCWVRHEVAHIKQYHQLGVIRFLILYLLETFNKGYYNNRFEVEARLKENDTSILSEIHFG